MPARLRPFVVVHVPGLITPPDGQSGELVRLPGQCRREFPVRLGLGPVLPWSRPARTTVTAATSIIIVCTPLEPRISGTLPSARCFVR